MAKNRFSYVVIDDEKCVVFQTNGKTKVDVIVDENSWDIYLSEFSWTATGSKGYSRVNVKTSINKQSQAIWRVIVEREFDEITWWGSTIDHVNNNPLDNRKKNLRVLSTILLNSINIASKFTDDGMNLIHHQKSGGYKFHTNIGGKTYYKHFGIKKFGSESGAQIAAKEYRDYWLKEERMKIIDELFKKTRDVEFERGLRDKLYNGEIDEVLRVLSKYHISAVEINK